MSSCFLVQLLLLFLLVYADTVYSKVHYITPSLDGPCLQNSSCLTLSQFATNSSYIEADTSLLFLPGNHTLDRELLLPQVNNFSMTKNGVSNETIFVECSTHSGRFHISKATYVSINDLHFIGCGSNNFSQVYWLTIINSTFQGVQEGNTVLVLNRVSTATIVRCSFLSNSLRYPIIRRINFIGQLLDYVYFQRNTRSGILYVAYSNVSILSSKFIHNRADIGGALVAHSSTLYLARSTYSNNTANFGCVMVTSESTINMDNNTFINNVAQSGGAMVTYNDNLFISSTTFNKNYADVYGGVMTTFGDSLFTISTSTFTNNEAKNGGVMSTSGDSSFIISTSTFTNNSAQFGGVLHTLGDSFTISTCIFTNNRAEYHGGIMITFGDSFFTISNSTFTNNTAEGSGGVMDTYADSSFNISTTIFSNNRAALGGVIEIMPYEFDYISFTISTSTFTNNRAGTGGVVYSAGHSSVTISTSTFTNNTAELEGGVMYTFDTDSTFTISSNVFVNNKATYIGGVFWCLNGTLNIDNSNFRWNAVSSQGGGLIFIRQCSTHITNSRFDENNGSLYTFNSNLTLSGHLTFENSMEPVVAGNGVTSQEGGAITSFQSSVVFTRESIVHFSSNRASDGGALFATESTIIIYGETTIANNRANSSGGGISLKQSRLEIKGISQFVNNVAVRGGGIYASSSTIVVYQPGTLHVINNTANFGGGLYLEVNPKLYILKNTQEKRVRYLLNFTDNHAMYGGAVYVADDTNSGACSPNIECFIQTLTLYQIPFHILYARNILFTENIASEKGANLFGGLLDRCIPSPFAEVYLDPARIHYSGANYLGDISNIDINSISSRPVRVCFCNSKHEPDCSYQPPVVRVQKGKAFNVSLVAVDQVNHTVDANITVSLSSSDGGVDEGQQIQSVVGNCTNLTFNAFSPHGVEKLNVSSHGPCGSATLSTSHVTIKFIECTCPVGFEPLSNSQSSTKCECICDSELSPYITECNITTSSVLRKDTNSWITYINDTDPPKYVIYQNCPFDYCQPQTKNITINFNLPNGADTQCAYNHTGVLCGACEEDLSLSLASSRCVPCHTHWPAVFVAILIAAAIAGILLVTALLALNMTVSIGLINGFIFYANIVSAGSAVFFPSSEPSFPSVFVAWLNLDMGIDVCFIDGLDAYAKTWLQLAFPVYIISLVVMVIIVSEYSPRFAGLIGKKDPVSTLATLILLSYAKLLSITITALSSAVLDYPDGHRETVWLPDGNVPFFKGKHIPLALVALLIIIIGLPYTILLFLWQWIVRAARWKVFKWTRDTKLNAFIASHHVPYNRKYR